MRYGTTIYFYYLPLGHIFFSKRQWCRNVDKKLCWYLYFLILFIFLQRENKKAFPHCLALT
jgi:hypothetical protein